MCRKYIHYKTQTGTSCEKCNSKAFRLGIEPASSELLDQCSTNWATEAIADNLGVSSVYIYDTRISYTLLWLSSVDIKYI